ETHDLGRSELADDDRLHVCSSSRAVVCRVGRRPRNREGCRRARIDGITAAMASSGTKFGAITLAAALAVAAGSWAWTQHQRAEARRSAGALVRDASESLREGLRAGLRTSARADLSADAGAAGLAKLEADARAIDGGLAEFGRVKASGERAL